MRYLLLMLPLPAAMSSISAKRNVPVKAQFDASGDPGFACVQIEAGPFR